MAEASGTDLPFLNTDLQRSIQAAGLQGKTLLCFVTDNTETSEQWESVLSDQKYRAGLTSQTVTLKITTATQEATYLNTVCPLEGLPAVVLVKRGSIDENLQYPQVTATDLRTKFDLLFAPAEGGEDSTRDETGDSPASSAKSNDTTTSGPMYIVLPPSTGRMRLPNNAYDAVRAQTQKWLDQNIREDNILRLQLKLLQNVPALQDSIAEIENRDPNAAPELGSQYQDRLLNTPAAVLRMGQTSIPSSPPTPSAQAQTTRSTETSNNLEQRQAPAAARAQQLQQQQTGTSTPPLRQQEQDQQRTNYVQAQKEREAKERAERDRIKAQIASDRAKQKHMDEVRRQAGRQAELDSLRQANSTTTDPQSTDIRVQVRTFDGSTIKTSFARDATISSHVRPWIDGTAEQPTPYNLKIILAPLPHRSIEAAEEDQTLSDLGIVGSATMVMVPVKGYVDSYAGGTGLVSTVTNAVGGVLGGLGGLIGWGNTPSLDVHNANNDNHNNNETSRIPEPRVRVRTLADQRAEEKKQSNELYNGNQLNFQGRKDDDKDKKQD